MEPFYESGILNAMELRARHNRSQLSKTPSPFFFFSIQLINELLRNFLDLRLRSDHNLHFPFQKKNIVITSVNWYASTIIVEFTEKCQEYF